MAVNWGGGGPTDIHAMYQTVGNAIQAVDPGALIIAEGPISIPLENFDLTQAASNPVLLNIPNKVVYSAHIYPSAIAGQPVDSGAAYVANINKAYGFLEAQNIAPVWIGEIGASLDGTADSAGANLAKEQAWAKTIVDFLNGKDGALGGPTFTGSQQGMSTDWWDWGYNPGQYPDGVLNADGSFNASQKAIWSQLLQAPITVKPPVTASPNGTVVLAGSSNAIIDTSGNKWTITASGQIAVNGVTDAMTASVKEIAYVNNTVWQENRANLWWENQPECGLVSECRNSNGSPLPTVLSKLTVNVSEDAWQGDAQFTVAVDGTKVGRTLITTASFKW